MCSCCFVVCINLFKPLKFSNISDTGTCDRKHFKEMWRLLEETFPPWMSVDCRWFHENTGPALLQCRGPQSEPVQEPDRQVNKLILGELSKRSTTKGVIE